MRGGKFAGVGGGRGASAGTGGGVLAYSGNKRKKTHIFSEKNTNK